MESQETAPIDANGVQFDPLRYNEERFWKRVDRSGGPDACWPWTVSFNQGGYGRVTLSALGAGQRSFPTHRVAYMLAKGPIPEGLHIDHLCENRKCANPAHLEAVTQAENYRRYRARRPGIGSVEKREGKSGVRWRVRFREDGKNRAVSFLTEQAAIDYHHNLAEHLAARNRERQSESVPVALTMRHVWVVKCDSCSTEATRYGSRAAAQESLTIDGWRKDVTGSQMCPDCWSVNE